VNQRNAIARTVRALPAIAGLQEIWQPRTSDGESDNDYLDFLAWLDKGSARGAPPARCAAVATKFEWAERALAYERATELAKSDAGTGTPEHQIISNLTRMVQLETAKLLRQSSLEVSPVVSLGDLLKTVHLIKDLQVAGIAAESAKADLSKLSVEDKRKILEAQKLLRQTVR
jgi:hypothetical protein